MLIKYLIFFFCVPVAILSKFITKNFHNNKTKKPHRFDVVFQIWNDLFFYDNSRIKNDLSIIRFNSTFPESVNI